MSNRIIRTGPLAVCLTLALSVGVSAQSLSIGGQNGVNADVSTSNGLGVGASVGGSSGVNANATVGGSSSAANANASVGGSNGVNANATVGGTNGLANVDVTVGGTAPGTTPGAGGGTGTDAGGLTPAQQEAFNNISDSERRDLLRRCDSVNAGSYDPQLVSLCRLLKLSAMR